MSEYENALKYDKRSFKQFFYDQLKLKNPLLYAFWRRSFVEPKLIRVVNFYLNITFVLALNALFYTDAVVEERNKLIINNPNSVNLSVYLRVISFLCYSTI